MRLAWLLLCMVLPCVAQDPFEIHVYEFEPMKRGEYSVEAHLNVWSQTRDTHLTFEPTIGLSKNFALGFMFLNAWQSGSSPQFAGWRVLPHYYAPWKLPVRIGFVAEFSFQKERFEENTRRVELRPILDREFEHWQVVFNPVVERTLHGPGTRRGWNFEPSVLLRWKREKFAPSLEYYAAVESLNVRPRAQPQVHQLYVGGDWEVAPSLKVNMGLGIDLKGTGVVLKSRFEWRR